MIDAAARGSWHELDQKLRPFIARRVRSEVDVDDVLQDVFLRMQRGLPNLRDDERFGPWVYRIARNAIVDHQRVAARHGLSSGVLADDPVADHRQPVAPAEDTDDAAERALAAVINRFVEELAQPYSEALTLTELQGLTQREAAERLGISVSGMKSRVQRGRQQVREALEACCDIALDVRGHVVSCQQRPAGKAPTGCCD